MSHDDTEADGREPGRRHRHDRDDVSLVVAAWNTLASMRLAVFVLIIFAVASLLGALLPQQGMSGPPSDEGIRTVYLQKYGSGLGKLMLRLSMQNLYGSGWYLALVVLLCLSTFACACRATKRARRRARLPRGDVTRDEVAQMQQSREATSPMRLGKALERSSAALRGLGYAVQEARSEDGSGSLVGRKFRWAVWASPLMHFSLLLIVVGGVVGLLPDVGFRDRLPLMEGETYDGQNPPPLPEHTHLVDVERATFEFALTLRSFDMTYYDTGAVREYESHIVATRNGEQIAEQRIRVNRPLRLDGINFYQSSWDLASVIVSVRAPDGTEELLEFPLSPTRDAMGRRSWFVPMEPLADALEGVSSTGWTVFCHDFWQDYPFAEGDDTSSSAHAGAMTRPRNRGEHPRNPAVSLIVYPDFEGDKQRYGKLGTLTTRDESSYEGYTFGLADVRKVSILDVRKDPGVPLLYAGFAGLTLAMMVVLYLMPRTVRLHARRERGTTHAVVGGTGRTGAFEREFAAIAEAVDAEATK